MLGGAGSFVLDREAVARARLEQQQRKQQQQQRPKKQQQGSKPVNQDGSFVLNREANLGQEASPPDSPKLWRPGTASPSHQSAPPPHATAATRTTDDLYKFYETISNNPNQDLSLKDLVEQADAPLSNGPLKALVSRETPQEAEAAAGGGGGERGRDGGGGARGRNLNRHHQSHHRSASPAWKHKATVPHKANGVSADKLPRLSLDIPLGEFISDRSDWGIGDWSRGGHPQMQSPRRSSSSRTPGSSFRGPSRMSSGRINPQSPGGARFDSILGDHSSPLRSPLRSPGPSRLSSPQRRVSQLASASSPARLNGGSRVPSAVEWVLPGSAQRSYHRANQAYSPASPLHQGNRFFLSDLFKPKVKKGSKNVHPAHHCSTCSSYTVFKTRCLVCGNIYCRNCVKDAMGSMPEGRKCTETCVGRPVHSRYINQAGKGCFYIPKAAKIAELKWVRRRKSNPRYTQGVHNNNSKSGTQNASPNKMPAMCSNSPQSLGLPMFRKNTHAVNPTDPSGHGSPLRSSSKHNQNAAFRVSK